MTKEIQVRIDDIVTHYIYQCEYAPDWANMQVALYDEGLTYREVYDIMQNVREEGVAP
jgi:thiaminase